MPLTPKPHQQRLLSDAIDAYRNGSRRVCLTAATGTGKSLVMQMLCEWALSEGKKVAVMSNRKLLTMQLARGLSKDLPVGVRAADFEAWTDLNASIQVCSVPTEASRVLSARKRAIERLMDEDEAKSRFKLFPADIVLWDEAHMHKGQRALQIMDEYQEEGDVAHFGVTATPLGIGHIYRDGLILGCNVSEGRKSGMLVPAECYEPLVVDLSKVWKEKTVLSQESLDKATRTIWTQHIVGGVYHHWKKLNPEARPSLGFAPGVKESLGMAMHFSKRGVNAAHISGESLWVDGQEYKNSTQEDRDEIFERLRSGDIKMIWNRFILREAIDLPFVENLILATPIASLLSYIQVCGRGLRASPSTGKKSATIIDHCGNLRLHGSPNRDRDSDWIAYFREQENKVTQDRINQLRLPECDEPEPITCPGCGRMRMSGSQCPTCQYEHSTSVRNIIQHDGTLVKSTEPLLPRRKQVSAPNTEKLWTQCYFQCRNAKRPMTFNQVRGLFKKTHKYDPPDGLAFMPKHLVDWSRQVKDVSMDRLHEGKRNASGN